MVSHLPLALDAGISSFRQRGAFVKEKVQDGRVLIKVWQNFDYRLDVCRVTKSAHIKHLWACIINLYSYYFITTSIYSYVHHTCKCNQLPNRSNHFDTRCIMRLT
jgi:hypothetical protein